MVTSDIENRLWAAADQLWANTGLKPAEFSTPVLGLIFLRYAETRFARVESRIGRIGSGKRHKISKDDYKAEGAIFLPGPARFSALQGLTESDNVGGAINEAMKAIEEENPDLKGVLHTTTPASTTGSWWSFCGFWDRWRRTATPSARSTNTSWASSP